jgi:hypothetical protein
VVSFRLSLPSSSDQFSIITTRKIGTVVEQALTYAMFDQKRTVTPDMVLKVKSLEG